MGLQRHRAPTRGDQDRIPGRRLLADAHLRRGMPAQALDHAIQGRQRGVHALRAEGRMTLRIYVAGPMTGYPDLNFPAFHAEAARLRALGHQVVNPAEINLDPAASWNDCMRADITQLVTCDTICMLPNWTRSPGATLECHIASALGFQVMLAGRST